MSRSPEPAAFPVDAHDRALLDLVRPRGWVQPTPARRYHLVAIGGGAAGLVAAMGAAGLGGRVALVERGLLGGDCLNTGCVPSKALLRAAHAAHAARGAADLGVRTGPVEVDFGAVMAAVRGDRARVAPHDAAARLRDAGVDLFLGHGRFVGPDALEVDGRTLRFARAVIATGGRPVRPPIPGLAEVGALTSEDVWNLTELPARLVVVGGGPVGCELAQAFARLGSRVVVVERGPRLLPRDDPDAAEVLRARLVREGVDVRLGASVVALERGADGERVVVLGSDRLACDHVLLAVGREVVTDGLGLEAAGVAVDERGRPRVDARLRTTNRRVHVAGDAAGRWQLTHASDATARLVLRNALFFGRGGVDDLVMPWATYTDPEVAHVGVSAEEARASGLGTLTIPFDDHDRSIVEGETEGFARFHHDRRGRIRGATIVGAHAGELIAGVAVAMAAGAGLGTLGSTILPYPTRAEVLKRAGDAWNRTRLTPRTARLLRAILALAR